MEQRVPKGPLAVRWRGFELGEVRAGALTTAVVELENVGTAAWSRDSIRVAYHWLDERGNPIVWDGLRTPVGAAPGEALRSELRIRGPIPPGEYRLAVDLVDEHRAWFEELGNAPLESEVRVAPRIDHETEAVAHLAAGVEPAEDWARRVFEAHQEGYAVVAGSIEAPRHLRRELEPYATGPGRVPAFAHPLVCPSVIQGVEVEWTEVAGLPAAMPPREEPWIYDARIRARLRSGRRRA